MLKYQMMDEQTLLCRCMHGGPVPHEKASLTISEVSQNAVETFLKVMTKKYGSCAVLVLDGDYIVGVLWFFPEIVSKQLGDFYCIQMEKNVKAIAGLNLESFPAKGDLSERSLRIECMMVVRQYDKNKVETDYTGLGIGKHMVETLIAWAKDQGWTRIVAKAIFDIKPLLLWSGIYSIQRYKMLGFREIEKSTIVDLLEAANSQKQGYHGPRIKKMWEKYSKLSDDEISSIYSMVLDL